LDWKDLDETSYDIIYSSGVYHFFNLKERNKFISKIKKILKPKGYFILNTLSSSDKQYYGKGIPLTNDSNSFQTDQYYLHFCSEEEIKIEFSFLSILKLFEYFHKNRSKDTECHKMWLLIGKNDKF
jgi:cyclopropane fatty-acyl-phospholipid synthase-like methyltransferase